MDPASCCSSSNSSPLIFYKYPTKLPTHFSAHPNKFKSSPNGLNHSIATKNNILLSSYSKSNTLDQTLKFFHLLSHRDTVTWNTVISACSRQFRFETALRLFLDMLISSSHMPDSVTFRSVLKACVQTRNFTLGLQLHAYMIKFRGLCLGDLITSTCLINLHCEFGSTEVARKLFDRMPLRDVVVCSSMMVGYANVGEYEKCVKIFENMLDNDYLTGNEFAFTSVLRASAGRISLCEGEQIHALIVKASLRSDGYVGTSLIDMYAKCDRMKCAKMAFSEISEPTVVSWNALMAGNLGGEEVLRLFSQMRLSGVSPDHLTFAALLRACKGANPCLVGQIHGLVKKVIGAEIDVFVGGALFDIYIDRDCVVDARNVFCEIHDKDITAFTLAIQGYVQNGHTEEAIHLFHEALHMGYKLNEVTLTALVMRIGGLNQGKQLHGLVIKFGFCGGGGGGRSASIASSLVRMYSEFDCLDNASQLFDQIDCPDVVLWTSLISGYSQSGESQEALKLYITMVSEGLGGPPNHYTFSSLLRSCANLAAVEEGNQIHAQIVKSNSDIASDMFVASSLVDMYAKCGYIMEARRIFDKMPERDIASWNAMITGLGQHGFAEAALETFQELLNVTNIEPNHVTFIGVLSACAHTGLVEDGYRYFKLIREPTIDHYACLINLVGRAGRLAEARNLIQQMPFVPNELIWSSLLAACGVYGNIELGEYSAQQLLQLNSKDPGTYVALSNIYAAAGRWEDVNKIRNLMKDRRVKKNPGFSWVRVKGKNHVFFTEIRSRVVE